ncbi:UDP-glucose 4-epimerase GalE [Candidatus Dependentiae bacterium]|nr:UDP-glucose 4-epimerase GalE [Candidatus Dependentiae bacterium]
MKKYILVTGAAGYIGSHIAFLCAQSDFFVIGIDIKTNPALLNNQLITLVTGDCTEQTTITELFKKYSFHAVIHCASLIEVHESVINPERYYHNNLLSTLNILHAMRTHHVKNIIFSSSCAVYGTPMYTPIDEKHPKNPISPYGTTKKIIEDMLLDYAAAYKFNVVSLRFFNAAGGWYQHGLGESHTPETHLLPRLISAAITKKPIDIFGTDYPTPDGTCIRDFVSVGDIARAHLATLHYLHAGGASTAINLGSGRGFSLLQIILQLEQQLNTQITVNYKPRRDGDPAILIANPHLATTLLGWTITEPIHVILQQALHWQTKKGF